MILIRVAAIPEVFLVGTNATMHNAHPYRVSEYNRLNKKNRKRSIFFRIDTLVITDEMKAVHTLIAPNKINHAKR